VAPVNDEVGRSGRPLQLFLALVAGALAASVFIPMLLILSADGWHKAIAWFLDDSGVVPAAIGCTVVGLAISARYRRGRMRPPQTVEVELGAGKPNSHRRSRGAD
jgi:hypothetical protein